MPRRCALGCTSRRGVLHVFPNPDKFPEQFKAWVNIAFGNPEFDFDYKTKRICDRHFTDRDHNRNNRLNALAVPSLFLPDHTSGVESTSRGPLESIAISQLDIQHPLSNQTTAVESTSRGPLESIAISQLVIQHPLSNDVEDVILKPMELSGSLMMSRATDIEIPTISTTTTASRSHITTDHSYCMATSKCFKGAQRKLPATAKYRIEQTKIKKLRREIYRLRKTGKSFKARLENAENLFDNNAFQKVVLNMTTPAKIFTGMQFKQSTKKPKGRRFALEEKVLSLSLYKKSPKCYSLLSKYFVLPSAKSLKRLLSTIKLKPGINKIVFEKLKNKVAELNGEDRLCTLIFDEMSITPQIHYDSAKDELKGFVSHGKSNIANHALVFMVKGIKKQFKQPVAYYFTNNLNKNELKNIIKAVIKKVQETGLIIMCTVCDQSTVNVSTINDLVEETKRKYLRIGKEIRHEFFEVNSKQIIPLYDTPHLLKGLRNNLLSKDLIYIDFDENKEKIIKWEYFLLLYSADKSFGELRCLQKLTEEHVVLEKIKKMRVKTAAQVFSHSVAVATEHLTARGSLPMECRDLIPLVILIDNLFDSLNVNSFTIPNGKIYKGPIKKNTPHHQLWQKSLKIFKSIKFVNRNSNGFMVPPTVKNFIKTIQGFQALWKILSEKYSFDVMLTRNMNQDPIENFFGNIRSYGARNVAPNCISFEGAYKSLLLNNYSSPQSHHANCESDTNKCLQVIDFFLNDKSIEYSDITEEREIPFLDEFSCNVTIDGDQGQRNYVCGWVLKKCLKNVIKTCKICKSDAITNEERPQNAYIRAKEYFKSKKWLCYPTVQLVKCFQEVQNICVSYLKRDVHSSNVRKNIKYYVDIYVTFPFRCEIHKETLKKYFIDSVINIIVYSWCRSINRILCGKLSYSGDEKLKTVAQQYFNKHKHRKITK